MTRNRKNDKQGWLSDEQKGNDMKRNLLNLLILITLMGLITGCGKQSDSLPAAPNTESSGMIETESDQDTTTEIVYDARTQTLSIQGVQDYAELSLPAEVKEARVLQVKDDAFTLSAYLPVLREADLDEQSELPEIIDRTALSLRFLKQYLYENAGSAYPDALIKIPVYFTIDRTVFGYRTDDEQITLQYNDAGTHREFLYLLALMNSNAIGWEQIGYAWYVGTCIDPYSEMPDTILIVPELPYYSQCIAGGIDPAQMSASDFRIVYDSCARVCFEKGLTHWGSYCESAPVTSESVFTRNKAKEPGDTELSAFMAASFLAWLDDTYGFEQVSLFCFGQKSFEEAFGTDFQSAFDAWQAWIEQTYPAE